MKFVYTIEVTPREGEGELDKTEVERFARMMDVAIGGAGTDCGVKAVLEFVTVLP